MKPAPKNRYCPACLRSQPVLDLPGWRVCTVCTKRWERLEAEEPTTGDARRETA